MRKFLLSLLLLPLVSVGQDLETTPSEELSVVEKIYYDRNVYIASEEERAKLQDLILEMRADSTLKVHIVGYCDKWGGVAVNDRFSYVRALHIAKWIGSFQVSPEQMTFEGRGIDTSAESDTAARRVEILTETEPETLTETEPETKPETVTETPPQPDSVRLSTTQHDPEPQPQPEPKPEPQPKPKPQIALRTNLLYLSGGLFNLGIEWQPNNTQLGVVLNGGYSPFGDTDWSHNLGGWFISPELRYYMPSNERWFVGVQFLAGGYNVKLSDTGRQGSLLGGGVMGGYKTALSRCFDIDFTLGVGYAHCNYDTYFRCEPNSINPYISKDVTKGMILPIQLGVNLIWKTNKR